MQVLTNQEFKDLLMRSTPWTDEETNLIIGYLEYIHNIKEYIEDADKETLDNLTFYENLIEEIQIRKDTNSPITEHEEFILKQYEEIKSKKEQKELENDKILRKKLELENKHQNHGGISAGLTIIFIVFNLGIFIASLILLLN